jgi:hypothetical protein
MEEMAKTNGIPFVKVPVNYPGRYSFPCLFSATLDAISKAFPKFSCNNEIEALVSTLEQVENKVGPSVPVSENVSKRIALGIGEKIPIVYGSSATKGVATRFKSVLNENAKIHVIAEDLTDMESTLNSWEDKSESYVPVFLRHSGDKVEEKRLIDSVIELLRTHGLEPIEVSGLGKSNLEQLASLVYIVDFASYYTGILLERDPYPTPLMQKMHTHV